MKLNQDEKLVLEELRNLSKLNSSEIDDILKALMMVVLLNFSENETTKIPYFGELKLEYLGDKTTLSGRMADLKVNFIPSHQLVKNIGQLIDVKNPNCDMKVTDIDCIKDIMNDITSKLNEIMEKE